MGEHSSSHGLHRMRRPLWRSKDRQRSPSPQICEKLIRKKVPSFSDAPPGQLQYNNSKDRFQARNKVAVKDLGKIIDAHDNEADTALKVGSSSWDLVFEQMAAAKTRNEERSDLGSKVTAGGDVISAYINLLPDDYGIGILKGGLALIFDATKAHDENRNKIVQTFETIPDSILTINMAFDLLDPDPADMKVQTEAVGMLLEDLPALIKILLGEEKWYRKVVRFLSLSIPETMTIDDILSRWDQKVVQLKEHVQRMKWKMCSKFSAELKSIGDAVKHSDMDIRALLAESKAMQTAIFHNTKKDYASILSEIYRGNEIAAYVASLMKEQMEGMTRERESFSREREHYQARELRLEERNQHLSVENETLRRKVSQNSIVEQPRVSLIDDVQLLDILGVDLDKLGDDSETILGHSEHSDTDERAKAQWLLQTDEFRNWLRENRSSLLLVDGELQDSFISPLSGICGGLISALVESRGSAVAFFFAGLHVDMQLPDIDSGPVAMIRSLIAQLLMSDNLPSRDLSFMSKDMIKGCREGDCLVLCEVFVKIIKQVPTQTTVYCIIDGVSWYEQGRWLDDLDEFATALEYVAKRNNAGRSGSLKVLLTSPTQSTEIGHLARKHRNVWWHVSLAAGHIHPYLGFMDSNSLPM
ncbi:hypothetical protein CGCS363_v006726 [Colletotrichum siamense]|uniref:uncharacterized protein n=1 Tax=Colletotrichum siamense TaxID=690259 RepID=UPI0018731F83|nr:uncharacterized protein CGCS363_v006726 [Colletotrichum siamense]KAF5501637.1 hypothetical protein CGCS363_v006726 [Colletotrichum siamense]